MKGLSRIYEAFHNGLASTVRLTSNIFLVLLTVLVFEEVVARYIFHKSHGFAEEWVRWMQVWIVYMMGAIAFMKIEGHISVDLVFSKMKENQQAVAIIITDVFALIFAAVLFAGGLEVVGNKIATGITSQREIAVPLWVPYLILPYGAILLALYSGDQLVRTVVSILHRRKLQK